MRIPANVKRGVELLDARLPGWRSRVDLDTLDLSSDCHCVVGQVLGDYYGGVTLLGITSFAEAARHGFLARGRQTFSDLTRAWKQVLTHD